jgi:hypothetical protein
MELLDLDIDVRLGANTWEELWRANEGDRDLLAALLRSAYGCGYADALSERQRGQLCRDHGLAIPKRRNA